MSALCFFVILLLLACRFFYCDSGKSYQIIAALWNTGFSV